MPPVTPRLTVDLIIELGSGVVLVERKHAPLGWALPGGFVDVGETLEAAAMREAKEETSLDVTLVRQFHAYSDPSRDPRGHTVSMVFIGRAEGTPRGGDDARVARVFALDELPELAFDHSSILADYLAGRY
ncbi:MAG: NUDIX hydrolase [Planctomycetota bacterium]